MCNMKANVVNFVIVITVESFYKRTIDLTLYSIIKKNAMQTLGIETRK